MAKIYCLGEAMSDTFITLEEAKIVSGKEKMICLPYGEKLNITQMSHKSGGSAFNVAVGLKRLGLESSLIASVGKDSEGARLIAAMDKEGIEHSNVKEADDFETKSAIILNGEDGDRTILVYHGKGVLNKEMINWDNIEDGSWFYLGPMPDTAKELIDYLLEVVVKKNLKLVVNPGSVQVDWPKEENLKVISKSELYVLNEEEAKKITAETSSGKVLLNSLVKAGAKKVIITDGMNGSDAFDGKNYYHQDIIKVRTLDMTGAGDAYLAAATGALIKEKELPEAMRWGAVNSAAVVEKLGAQAGLLSTI
jgi:sugar/nucleoside kinase (ribokinase family)